MEQGDIWWAQLPAPMGRRPVLILTRSRIIPRLTSITIAPLTRSARPIPTHVRVSPQDGVSTESVINLDNIQTIPTHILVEKMVHLRHERMDEVFAAIRAAFDMPR